MKFCKFHYILYKYIFVDILLIFWLIFRILKIDIILVVILEYKKNIVNQNKPIVSHRNNTNVFKIGKKRNLESIAFWCRW